ncbi:hypothetical protein V6N13_006044 [Hibiscus sabdariffa]
MAGLVSSDTSACGGVLIVNGGVFRALFAGPVAHLSLAMATLRVVLVALSIFLETRLAENFGLEVEIGSVQPSLDEPWSHFDELVLPNTTNPTHLEFPHLRNNKELIP